MFSEDQLINTSTHGGNKRKEREIARNSKTLPAKEQGSKKRALLSVHPLIQREYEPNASIFTGSEVLKAFMQRGIIRDEQIESSIKVLKSAQLEPCDNPKPPSSSLFKSSTKTNAVGEAATSPGALGNTQTQPEEVARPAFAAKKRKAPAIWPASALEKHARNAIEC